MHIHSYGRILKGFVFPLPLITVSPSCSFSGLTTLGDIMTAWHTFNDILNNQTMFEWSSLIVAFSVAIWGAVTFCQMAFFGGKKDD